MSKSMVIGLVAGVLVLLGGGAFLATRNSDESSSSSAVGTQTDETATGDTPEFTPVATNEKAFVATMNGTTAEGADYAATIEFNGEGSSHYTGTVGDNSVEFFVTPDDYILCSDGGCFRYGSDQQAQNTPGEYEYSEEDFNAFKELARYQGRESCPAGTCDVWEVDQEDGYVTKVFIDDSNLVSLLVTNGPEGEFTITYEYKPVTINLPKNVQTLQM